MCIRDRDSVSGLELPETTPRISDESVVRSAIGQATHNYTAAELARYVTAIANSGNLYQLSILDKITDSEGNVPVSYTHLLFSGDLHRWTGKRPHPE